jgi:hypothetical protein
VTSCLEKNEPIRRAFACVPPDFQPINYMAMQDLWLYLITGPLHSNPPELDDQR